MKQCEWCDEDYVEGSECHDQYGNPTDGSSLPNCCFPDCGCDGSRLCMAESGANERCFAQNVEGMYAGNNSPEAKKARWELFKSVMEEVK